MSDSPDKPKSTSAGDPADTVAPVSPSLAQEPRQRTSDSEFQQDRAIARLEGVFTDDVQAEHAATLRALERRAEGLPADAIKERAELARAASIQRFVMETLGNEPRLPERMDTRCAVAVVAPAYNERGSIVQLLSSLANQEGVDPATFEAIIVVNNPPATPARQDGLSDAQYARQLALYDVGVPDNQETLALLAWLRDPQNPPPQMTEDERVELERIRASGVRIQAIDKASPGRTFIADEANVGGSRNYGVAAAIERFHDHVGRNGIIVQTDADSQLRPDYIANVAKLYESDPELVGATGDLAFVPEGPQDVLAQRVTTCQEIMYHHWKVGEMYLDRSASLRAQSSGGAPQPAQTVLFSGANMTSRAYEIAYVGGLKKSLSRERADGGEDPDFGNRLAKIGKIAKEPSLHITTADRDSARTAVWAGMGQQRIKLTETLRANGTVTVKRLADAIEMKRMSQGLLSRVGVPSTTGADILRHVVFRGTPLLTVDEAEVVAAGYRRAKSVTDIANDATLMAIKEKFDQRRDALTQDVPIEQDVDAIVAEMRADARVGPEYERAYDDFVQQDESRATARRGMLKRFVDLGFGATPRPATPAQFLVLLREHAEELALDQNAIARFETRKDVLGDIVAALGAQTIDEAHAMSAARLAPLLTAPKEGSLEDYARKLRALERAFERAR